ncbi:MAG: hypothetical protein WKF73_05780 [Nocardioidaceae bacterium]
MSRNGQARKDVGAASLDGCGSVTSSGCSMRSTPRAWTTGSAEAGDSRSTSAPGPERHRDLDLAIKTADLDDCPRESQRLRHAIETDCLPVRVD